MTEAIVLGLIVLSALFAWSGLNYLEAGKDKPHDGAALFFLFWGIFFVPAAFYWLSVQSGTCAC